VPSAAMALTALFSVAAGVAAPVKMALISQRWREFFATKKGRIYR